MQTFLFLFIFISRFQNYHIDLNYLVNMPGLRALKIRGFSGNNMTKVLPLSNFESLIHLKSLVRTIMIILKNNKNIILFFLVIDSRYNVS